MPAIYGQRRERMEDAQVFKVQIGAKILTAAIVFTGIVAACLYFRPSRPGDPQVPAAPAMKTQTVTKTKTLPGGTTVRTETTTEYQKVEKPLKNWKVDLGVKVKDLKSLTPDYIEIERRLYGPVWGTTGYQFDTKSVYIGLGVEF